MIDRLVVGPLANNVYLVRTDAATVLVDAADDAPAVLAWLAALAPDGIDAILTTHQHRDHIGALASVAEATDAAVFAGIPDVEAIASATGVEVHGLAHKASLFGMKCLALAGHTPGGLALVVDDDHAIITGDSLFPGGVGKTNSPQDFTQLLDDVEKKIFKVYDDDTVIWPGHGLPTTLGAERPHLAEWRERGW